MRGPVLAAVLAVALATPALAQSRGAKTAPATSRNVDFMAQLVARSFFRALVAGEIDALIPLCAPTVSFDGHPRSKARLRAGLAALVARSREKSLELRRVTTFAYPEMVRRFGPPPARLAAVARPKTVVALARFDRRGAIAVLRRIGRFYRVVAISD